MYTQKKIALQVLLVGLIGCCGSSMRGMSYLPVCSRGNIISGCIITACAATIASLVASWWCTPEPSCELCVNEIVGELGDITNRLATLECEVSRIKKMVCDFRSANQDTMAQVRDTVGQVSSLQYSVNGIGERIESLQTSLTTLDAKTTDRVQEILCIIQELGEQVAVLQDVLLDITTAIEQEAAASGECNTNTVIIVNFDTTLQ
jgi:hypothetical protein